MNKRQARRLALEIAICVINKEWTSVSDLTGDVIDDNGFDAGNAGDFQKVLLALADIEAELSIKKARMKG